MIPWTLLGTANIPNNGGVLKLTQRENDFSIHLTGVRGELMNSRMHSSELALAELGCAHIQGMEKSKVLVGGLGISKNGFHSGRRTQSNSNKFSGRCFRTGPRSYRME